MKIFRAITFCGLTLFALSAISQTVNSAMFGSMEARALGPGTTSGRITSIKGVESDEGKTIYVGTGGGGVWKSTNAGASYKPVFDKHCQSIGAIAINQKSPNVVYAGTGESNMRNSVSIGNGLYKSTDAGDNWKRIGLDSTEHISKILLDPNNPDIIYVAAPGPLWSSSPHRGLYKSANGGETWEKILYVDTETGCADLLIDPTNPNIIFASMWQFRRQPYSFNSGGTKSGLYKSTDGGKSWREIKNGLPPKPFGRIAMALAPSDPKNLVAIIESKETGLYISSDGGETWKQQAATMNITARPFYFSTIEIDPKDPKRVYRPAFTFAYSNDGGYSFNEASNDGGWVHVDMHALWINPAHTNILYVGTDGGVYSSVDRGVTWNFSHGLPVAQFYHVACDQKEPYNVYGGLQDNGSWVAPSAAPGGVNNASWVRLFGGDGFWTVPDHDGKTVYVEYQGGNMYRTNIETLKAEDMQPQRTAAEEKLRWNWNTPIVISAKNPKHLYTGSQYLYKSTDQGRNWTRISGDLTTNDKKKQEQEESGGLSEDNTSAENHCTIFSIAESPLDENIVWAGTDDGNLQVTTDGGKTWRNTSAAVAACGIAKQAWVSSIKPSRFDKQTVYATFDNHAYGDMRTYLAKSTDLGKTWTRINHSEFTGFAHKIEEDTENRDLLFLGTEMGLFCSLDGGKDWFRMKNKIPEYAMVRDLVVHPKSHDLIVGTHGRGIYIVDDIRPIRLLTKEIREKDVHIFETPQIVLNNGPFGWGGRETSGGWWTENPSSHPEITYYLKQKPLSGKVAIDILDDKGNLIQSIPATSRKGINKVSWNLRGNPPRVAAGSTKLDGAAFSAPMVLPGEYTVKLKIKDKEYTGKLTCVHDAKNNDLTVDDRKLVYDKSMQLQSLYNRVNQSIDTIMHMQALLKKDTVAFKKNKQMKLFYDDLQKVKGELTATKKVSIFADEERLREKISDLYGAFCGMEAKPSTLQVDAIQLLESDYKKQEESLKKTFAQHLPKLNLTKRIE